MSKKTPHQQLSKKPHLSTLFFASIALTLCVFIAMPVHGDDRSWDKRARTRKAEAAALQSFIAMSENRADEFMCLIDYAYDLDSTDLEIGSKWGMAHLYPQNPDTAQFQKAYDKIKSRFLAHPDDYNEALVFASITQKFHRFDDEVMAWTIIDSLNPSKTDPAIYLANAYMHKYILGDTAAYHHAIDIYNRIESGVGNDMGLSSMKIRALALKKDTAAIVSELGRLYRSAPSDPNINLFLGDNFNRLEMPDSAIIYLNNACRIDPTNGAAYLARAEFFKNINDSVAYDREVFRALKSPNLEFDSKFSILTNYISALYNDPSQTERIKDLFTVLEEMHPGEPNMHMLYGYYLFAIKDAKQAAEQFAYAAELEPSNDEAWSAQLQMYVMIDDHENIYRVASTAFNRFPDNLYYPIMAANALVEGKEDYAGALDVLKSVNIPQVNNPTGVSNFYSFRANMYSKLDSVPQAFADYEKALKLDPENYMAMNNYAFLLAENDQNLELAERLSNLSLKSKPQSPTFLDTYAWILFKRKEYAFAKDYIDQVLQMLSFSKNNKDFFPSSEPGNALPESKISSDQLVANSVDSDEDEENDSLAREIEASENSAEIFEHAGDIYFMNGEPRKALILWKKALELEPDREILQRKVKNKTYFFE